MIEIRNLCKTYSSKEGEVIALQNVNLTIRDGEAFGIIGLSGAGKSSLLRCINMLEKPSSGEILIGGTDITRISPAGLRELRKKIGMIFQHFHLLMNATVYDNIAFPLRISKVPEKEIEKRVNELLEVVELTDKRRAYPSQLSGGQKQRVGIARALANHPDILLSDESTSALDPATTESILNLLKGINRQLGITIISITHEMSVIKKLCNRVAVMEDGLIIEEGKVIDLFTDPKTLTSKRFIQDIAGQTLKEASSARTPGSGELIRLSFVGSGTGKPVLSHMIKSFNIDANILAGNIDKIQDTPVGNLIIELTGASADIQSAKNYLLENGLRIEVLQNGQF